MGDAQMSRATDVERTKFLSMLDHMTDIELAKPYILLDSKAGGSLNELAIKYKLTKKIVWRIVNAAKNTVPKTGTENAQTSIKK